MHSLPDSPVGLGIASAGVGQPIASRRPLAVAICASPCATLFARTACPNPLTLGKGSCLAGRHPTAIGRRCPPPLPGCRLAPGTGCFPALSFPSARCDGPVRNKQKPCTQSIHCTGPTRRPWQQTVNRTAVINSCQPAPQQLASMKRRPWHPLNSLSSFSAASGLCSRLAIPGQSFSLAAISG